MAWKKIVMVVTAVLVLALLSAIWWISRYDYNRLKPIIAEQIRAATVLTAGNIVGGVLMGPTGIAMAFSRIEKDAAANPCLEAAQTAEKGVVPEEKGVLENIGDKLRFWKKD